MMKKIFHFIFIALGGLIVVGVVLVVINPGNHKSGVSARSDRKSVV